MGLIAESYILLCLYVYEIIILGNCEIKGFPKSNAQMSRGVDQVIQR